MMLAAWQSKLLTIDTYNIADRAEDRAQSECRLREGRRPENASSADQNEEN